MQFTEEVAWDLADFAIIGSMLVWSKFPRAQRRRLSGGVRFPTIADPRISPRT